MKKWKELNKWKGYEKKKENNTRKWIEGKWLKLNSRKGIWKMKMKRRKSIEGSDRNWTKGKEYEK